MLIVDDEDAICKALTVLFRRAGYSVVTARSAQVAKDLLGTVVVDCLVIDYRIPDLRGDVLFAYAVAVQPHLEGHAVFLTGDLKPFENSQLLGLVSRFFEDLRTQRPS